MPNYVTTLFIGHGLKLTRLCPLSPPCSEDLGGEADPEPPVSGSRGGRPIVNINISLYIVKHAAALGVFSFASSFSSSSPSFSVSLPAFPEIFVSFFLPFFVFPGQNCSNRVHSFKHVERHHGGQRWRLLGDCLGPQADGSCLVIRGINRGHFVYSFSIPPVKTIYTQDPSIWIISQILCS